MSLDYRKQGLDSCCNNEIENENVVSLDKRIGSGSSIVEDALCEIACNEISVGGDRIGVVIA